LFRWRRSQLEQDLIDELELHRSLAQAAYERAGVASEAAFMLSARRMGSRESAREECRELWSFTMIENALQDLRYAARLCRRSAGFTAVAVLSLAIGIGGNAAIFSLVDCLLLRPLPYQEPERLVRITGIFPRAAVRAFQDESRTMTVAAATAPFDDNLSGFGQPMRVSVSAVSANAARVLGVSPALGRSFDRGEDAPGRDGVVILSDTLWRTHFGANPAIVGRIAALSGKNREVVGVMPPGFSFPLAGTQAWIPLRLDSSNFLEYWGAPFVPLYGRLQPGVGVQQAADDVHALVEKFRPTFPYPMARDFNAGSTAVRLQEDVVGQIRGKLVLLLAAVATVLLIACVNLASLLLSRSAARRQEIALRVALGAGRARIVRQLLAESALLSCGGAIAGLALGASALSIFKAVLPASTPGLAEVAIDWRITAVVMTLGLLTGLAFGITPALAASRVDFTASAKTVGRGSADVFWTRMRGGLVSAEIALTVVLVVGAALLIRSLYALAETPPGFGADGILTVRVSPNESACMPRPACIALFDRLQAEARGLPGVAEVELSSSVPLDGTLPTLPVDVEGHPKSVDHPAPLFWAGAVSPGYTRLMRIPLLAGRELSEADGVESEPVILVSASTARRYWPGESAIGKHVKSTGEGRWRTVVGVVGDVRQFQLGQGLPEFVLGAMYMPYAQAVRDGGQIPVTLSLLVKASAASVRVSQRLRQVVQDQVADAPVSSVRSLDEIARGSVSDFRSTICVFACFAAVALALAAIGVYGILSYWVAQRRYEIGLRAALGATRSAILRMIFGEASLLAAGGVVVGLLAALALARLLGGLLHGIAPNDPLTFAVVAAFVYSVALGAALLPARRAAAIDPARSLRAD
jgi:predicted permease